MSNKSTPLNRENKKSSTTTGLSTFTKILLSLFLLLAIVVAGFMFHAWRVLTSTTEFNNSLPPAASIEVLTPNGAPANQASPTPAFIPQSTTTAASISTGTTAGPEIQDVPTTRPSTAKPPITTNDTDIQPILPINVPPAQTTNTDNPPTPKPKPVNNNNGKPIDNLF